MPKKYLLVVLMALSCLMASAQNSIDRMVEQYSTLGGSSFVTAVKRNPKTHKVYEVGDDAFVSFTRGDVHAL